MAQLMPLPLTIFSCFSKIQIGFTFLVLAHPGSPGKRAVKRVCVLCTLYVLVFAAYPQLIKAGFVRRFKSKWMILSYCELFAVTAVSLCLCYLQIMCASMPYTENLSVTCLFYLVMA